MHAGTFNEKSPFSFLYVLSSCWGGWQLLVSCQYFTIDWTFSDIKSLWVRYSWRCMYMYMYIFISHIGSEWFIIRRERKIIYHLYTHIVASVSFRKGCTVNLSERWATEIADLGVSSEKYTYTHRVINHRIMPNIGRRARDYQQIMNFIHVFPSLI